ncbi:MAG: UDP-N-acetylglucosamine 2-epimerase (non-hydrolyzing) [Chromatiales bacterium]|nr:UDP-N-acetylglucosamine 2-epimerase (non-hydrolyzing) [Chromatiales bacterium]
MARSVIHVIAAARPNFMKVAPLLHALREDGSFEARLVHTGQHYDANMSDAFFSDLGMPEPAHHLGIGSGSHAEQTGRVMIAYEAVAQAERPACTIVVGDVNSTAAVAMVCAKLLIPVVHLEAGLRSFDRTMPEEINRLVTDVLADVLWTPSPDGDENLRREGIPESRIERVGNIMLDSYELMRERIEADGTMHSMGLAPGAYGVVTLHRPANVDEREPLALLVSQLRQVAEFLPLVFPVHPRTRKSLAAHGLAGELESVPGIRLVDPVGYVQFMNLVSHARLVITDSGGVQEETTYLDIPCLTVRPNTERPVTISEGTNRLVPPAELVGQARRAASGDWPRGRKPELWDGQTAARCVASLKHRFLFPTPVGADLSANPSAHPIPSAAGTRTAVPAVAALKSRP